MCMYSNMFRATDQKFVQHTAMSALPVASLHLPYCDYQELSQKAVVLRMITELEFRQSYLQLSCTLKYRITNRKFWRGFDLVNRQVCKKIAKFKTAKPGAIVLCICNRYRSSPYLQICFLRRWICQI